MVVNYQSIYRSQAFLGFRKTYCFTGSVKQYEALKQSSLLE